MGWEDRDYHRTPTGGGFGGGGGGGWANQTASILNASFPIAWIAGIRVRVHITFVLYLAFELLDDLSSHGSPLWTLRWFAILFGSVLAHEFGHCLACRSVGGTADDILMWPLGGLAFCAPPRRPWPEFVTVIWGPLVTIILAAAAYTTLLFWFGAESVSLNPFGPRFFLYVTGAAGVVRDIYIVNYALALFNLLLVFYPFDGGRLIQIALWAKFGYYKSMRWATSFGMAGAGATAVFGIMTGNWVLVGIAAMGFFACMQQAQYLKAVGESGQEFDPGYYTKPRPRRRGWVGRWSDKRTAARQQHRNDERAKEDAEVDRILQKVKDHGLHSLSAKEKRVLQRATERQRQTG